MGGGGGGGDGGGGRRGGGEGGGGGGGEGGGCLWYTNIYNYMIIYQLLLCQTVEDRCYS